MLRGQQDGEETRSSAFVAASPDPRPSGLDGLVTADIVESEPAAGAGQGPGGHEVVAVNMPRIFSTVGLPEVRRIELWESHNAAALIGLSCHTAGFTSATYFYHVVREHFGQRAGEVRRQAQVSRELRISAISAPGTGNSST
jgi:hypothetical protein